MKRQGHSTLMFVAPVIILLVWGFILVDVGRAEINETTEFTLVQYSPTTITDEVSLTFLKDLGDRVLLEDKQGNRHFLRKESRVPFQGLQIEIEEVFSSGALIKVSPVDKNTPKPKGIGF